MALLGNGLTLNGVLTHLKPEEFATRPFVPGPWSPVLRSSLSVARPGGWQKKMLADRRVRSHLLAAGPLGRFILKMVSIRILERGILGRD
jgi:hypothetical protein